MVIVRGSVEKADRNDRVGERGEQGECRGGGEEVERGVVYELGGVGVAGAVVGVAVGVLGDGEVGGGDLDGEFGEGAAEGGLVWDGGCVGEEGDGCVEACCGV